MASGSPLPLGWILAMAASIPSQPSESPPWARGLSAKRLALPSLPLVSGVRAPQGTGPRPAALANARARGPPGLLPEGPNVATADMSSVTHREGTPPRDQMSSAMHLGRPSPVLVGDLAQRCRLGWPSVGAWASRRCSDPDLSCMGRSPLQPDWGRGPGGVPKRGWACGGRSPGPIPRVRRQLARASWPGTGGSSPACLPGGSSCIPFAAAPGMAALSPTSSR